MAKNLELQQRREAVIPPGHTSGSAIYIASARGAVITDVEGRDYIDFTGGIAVMNVGHSHPKVVQAIKDQAEKFTHTCFMVVPYGIAVELAEKLYRLVPGSFPKTALFVNSGAEAVENAVKIARYATKKTAIIAFDNAYHGRTLLTMTLTSKDNGIVFISDEVQTGIGRTGKMFAMEHYGVEPDITTVAKSLAAGMPLSAVVGEKNLMATVHPSGVGGTYSGNPVCCAAALAVLAIFEEDRLLERAVTLGQKIRERLESWKKTYALIGDVRGLGPMQALELVKDRHTKAPAAEEAKALVKKCAEKGLIILACGSLGNVIRILMPLVITDEQLDKGMTILEEGIAALSVK